MDPILTRATELAPDIKIIREMVPGAGIEPARPEGRQILSLLRLPISPPGLWGAFTFNTKRSVKWRREPESNRPTWICNPVHNRFAIAPYKV